MKRKNPASIIFLFSFIWTCYRCDQVMSAYGIYEVFSYGAHELLSSVPFVGFAITLIWCMILLIRCCRKKGWKDQCVLLAILILFSTIQFKELRCMAERVSVSTHITIESLDPKTLTLQARTSSGTHLTLSYPMMIGKLLKEDGTEYYVNYKQKNASSSQGVLTMVYHSTGAMEPQA